MKDIELILGNSNPRFSGVTSTMLQVLNIQKSLLHVAVLGKHHVPEGITCLSFFQTARLCKKPLVNGKKRVFHARRNDEVIQALLLKYLFRAKIRIAFTATSQRQHSWITRFLIRQCDAIITTCSGANQFIAGGADITIPHGIDTSTYFPAKDREEAWKQLKLTGQYGIGIFGRVRHQKGIDILIHASIPLLKKYTDFTIVICGKIMPKDQQYVDKLKAEIATHDLTDRYLFLGEQPFSKIPSIMRSMSIVTALSRNEGFGLTIPEAMASGVAVLASEAGAWKDIITNGTEGYVIPCDDVEETANKLELLLSKPEELIKLGKKGYSTIKTQYTIEEEAKKLSEFLMKLA